MIDIMCVLDDDHELCITKLQIMNTAHWHLVMNHLPIVGVIIGTLILAAGFVIRNNRTVKSTGLGVLVFAGIAAIPSYLTGEGAEEVVEGMPGVSENWIEAHEDLALIFLIFTSVLGVISLITLMIGQNKPKVAGVLMVVALIGGLITSFFGKQVGTTGGEIRHTEIRTGNGAQQNSEAGQGTTEAEEE